jgi:hypothetical protein
MIPYNKDTRETYIQRMADNNLHAATFYHKHGINLSMWVALLYYAMAEDLYGEHWDSLQKRGQA